MNLASLRSSILAILCFFPSLVFATEVNINTASAQEIAEALSGVGDAKAAAIVSYREQNGPFNSVEELTAVKGIGEATIEKNRDSIVVNE